MKYFLFAIVFVASWSVAQIDQAAIDRCFADKTCAVFRFSWPVPTARVNGDTLTAAEIGGYEISYREVDTVEYKQVIISSAFTTTVIPNFTDGVSYEFRIAAFDSDGLYSDYSEPVVALALAGGSKIVPIDQLYIEPDGDFPLRSLTQIMEWCQARPSCQLGITVQMDE